MTIWFEGDNEIDCSLRLVEREVDDLGALYQGIVALMPGLTNVELVDQGDDHVTIKTNEGLMRRSHFQDDFTATATGVRHHLAMSDVEAPGFLGFFYRRFGSAKTGTAFLSAYKQHLEAARGVV